MTFLKLITFKAIFILGFIICCHFGETTAQGNYYLSMRFILPQILTYYGVAEELSFSGLRHAVV